MQNTSSSWHRWVKSKTQTMFLNFIPLDTDSFTSSCGNAGGGGSWRERQSPGRGEDEIQRSMHPGFAITWDSANWIRLSHFSFAPCSWWFSETIHTFWVVLSKKEAYCIRIKKKNSVQWTSIRHQWDVFSQKGGKLSEEEHDVCSETLLCVMVAREQVFRCRRGDVVVRKM